MEDRSPSTFISPFYEEPRPADPLWQIGKYSIVRCRASGLVYLGNPLNEEELREFYSPEYFEGDATRKGYASYEDDERILRINFRQSLRRIVRDLAREGRDPSTLSLLDFGCAYGYFLDEARTAFKRVQGIEVNDAVARIGRERFGLEIASGVDAAERLAPESVDVITMWDVLEHLSHPRRAIESCRRALRPGGRLYITTGDIDSLLARVTGRAWRLVNPPQHISYFSVRTLGHLLRACGLEVAEVTRPGRRVSLGFMKFIVNYLLRRSGRSQPARAGWLMRRSFYVNLFDVMMIGARKPPSGG